MALPGWVAVMEQVPEATRATAIPETVQTDGVVEAKLTGRPEVAVALKLKGGVPSDIVLMGANDIVCADKFELRPLAPTRIVCVTEVARLPPND